MKTVARWRPSSLRWTRLWPPQGTTRSRAPGMVRASSSASRCHASRQFHDSVVIEVRDIHIVVIIDGNGAGGQELSRILARCRPAREHLAGRRIFHHALALHERIHVSVRVDGDSKKALGGQLSDIQHRTVR